MIFVEKSFKNEEGNDISIALGSCSESGQPRIFMEIAGRDSKSINILTFVEFDEILRMGLRFREKAKRPIIAI